MLSVPSCFIYFVPTAKQKKNILDLWNGLVWFWFQWMLDLSRTTNMCLNVGTSKYGGEGKKVRDKKYLALNAHVNMNICKFRNVYDATPEANAAHREKFMMKMLQAYYFYGCIECTCFLKNISPRLVFHVMTELGPCGSGHQHYKAEKGCIRLTLYLKFYS